MKTTTMKNFLFSIVVALLGLWLFQGAALASSGSTGKEFYFSFQPNYESNGALSLFITSEQDTTGTVEVAGLNFSKAFSVLANKVTTVAIPSGAQRLPVSSISNLAVRVVAEESVTVYGLNLQTHTTDAFLALPVDALGVDYYALSYKQTVFYPSQLVVVGAFDGTQVTITPSAQLNSHPAGVPFTVTLNRGQTYMLTSTADVSGTSISASAPVGVMSGVECVNIPAGVSACDHIVEMMPPVSTWGKSFLTVPLATRRNGEVFRILAAQDGTKVNINGTLVATLQRGKFFETVLKVRSEIETSAPVLVSQYSPGTSFDGVTSDPFMMLIPPTEQFMNQYTFSTPASGFSTNFVNVVIPSGEVGSLRLDGSPVDPARFSAIGTSGFSGGQLPISLGSHHLISAASVPFGIYVYGFAQRDSYGYPGGMSFNAINPVGDKYLPALRLVQNGDIILGTATDSEDTNANGILDADEDMNGNGTIDRRSEDINGNGKLDPGEDTNQDGILDRDTGVSKIALLPGADNLKLEIVPFIPGSLSAAFSISRIDSTKPGTGTVQVEDGAGNKVDAPVLIGGIAILKNVRIIETISTQGIDLDLASFVKAPFSITDEPGKKLIEWRFDTFSADSQADLGFDITLKNPVPGENRLISYKLDLFYTDANGKPVHTALDSRSVDVLPSIYQVTPMTDKSMYGANELVQITGSLKNLSEHAGAAAVRLSILDAGNALIASLGTTSAHSVAAGATTQFTGFGFGTNINYAGNYKVLAEAVDGSGNVLAVGSVPFAIGIASGASVKAVIATDKGLYSPFDTVRVSDRIVNMLTNANVDDLRVITTVSNPDNSTRFTKVETLQQLPPALHKDYAYDVRLAAADAGQYTASLLVTSADGTQLAQASAKFSVGSTADSGIGLVGTITALPAWLNAGQTLDLAFNATNNGNGQLTDLPLTVSIVDPNKQQIIAEYPYSTSLPIGGAYSNNAKWIAASDSGATYVAVLSASVGGKALTLAQTTFTVIKLDINQSLTKGGRVLALVSCNDGENDTPGKDGKPALCETKRAQIIDQALTALEIPHLVATNPADFKYALRSGLYNTYWISGKQDKLTSTLVNEVREAVFAGDGAILDGVHDQRNKFLDAIAGITWKGKIGETDLTADMTGSMFKGRRVMATVGRSDKFELNGAIEQGILHGKQGNVYGPAIFTHSHGMGRVATYASDLPYSLDAQGAWQGNLSRSLDYVLPDQSSVVVPGAIVPVQTSITSLGQAVDLAVKSTVPVGGLYLGSNPTGSYDTDTSSIHWTLTLGEGQTQDLWLTLRAPETAGESTLHTIVSTLRNGTASQYGDALTVSMTVTPADSIAGNVTQKLSAMALTQNKEVRLRDNLAADLQQAMGLFNQNTAAGYESAIVKLIQIIDGLAGLPGDTTAVRLDLDGIIKEAQWRWTGTQPVQ